MALQVSDDDVNLAGFKHCLATLWKCSRQRWRGCTLLDQFQSITLDKYGAVLGRCLAPTKLHSLMLAVFLYLDISPLSLITLLCIIDRPMEQGLTYETGDSAVYCLTFALLGGMRGP